MKQFAVRTCRIKLGLGVILCVSNAHTVPINALFLVGTFKLLAVVVA
jgi:hypothetical protein